MSTLQALKRVRILQGLSVTDLEAVLAGGQLAIYRRNEVVFEAQSSGRELYIVLDGEVAVMVDPATLGTIERGSVELRVIRTIGPGESFGELAFFGAQARSATVVATRDHTTLLVLRPQIVEQLVQQPRLLRNIMRDIINELHNSNARMIESLLSGHFLTVLVEELASGVYECSPIVPLEKLVVIRHAESFILSGPGRLVSPVPHQEAIEVCFFAEPAILRRLTAAGVPSGIVILSALFSVIRSGRISERIAEAAHFQVDTSTDRRTGRLVVHKTGAGHVRPLLVEWQIKGARYDPQTRATGAHLFLHIYDDASRATNQLAHQMIADIAMPVHQRMYHTLARREPLPARTRVLVLHHRTHEVARTLQTVQQLGYHLDTFIGIPYGDVAWEYSSMLDHAAGHTYLSLKRIAHPTKPPRYQIDFKQSSLLDMHTEQDLVAMYEDPAIAGDYLAAMQALAEYCLARALRRCREHGERLVVYEDGGYIVARIYELYVDLDHALHDLVRSAVDSHVIVGVVEVTVAGERKNEQLIERNNGQALLPVLSGARSDIKAVYEAIGVSEAVIHAAATAFGRLGLPTFQHRRLAILGGNGAIGTRLVEQLTLLHNSTANVFAVDISERSFAMDVDRETVPFAATRLQYRHLPRFVVQERCLPMVVDLPYGQPVCQPDLAAMTRTITNFLSDPRAYQELALTNSYPLPIADERQLWQTVARQSGFDHVVCEALPNNAGARYHLSSGGRRMSVALLAAGTILTFVDVARLIRNGVDTVIGTTGYAVFSARDLDAFFARPSASASVDALALISASSKDHEFRRPLDLLNNLVILQTQTTISADVRLGWFADLYQDGMSFLQDEDFAAIRDLLAASATEQALRGLCTAAPALAAAIGITAGTTAQWRERLADYIAWRIRQRLTIRKEIRPDIGSIYHLVVNGQAKRVVMLADGLVVNFFARHEKGVKTEYMDPIVTQQVLGLLCVTATAPAPGLYKLDTYLRPDDIATLWAAIDERCRPVTLDA